MTSAPFKVSGVHGGCRRYVADLCVLPLSLSWVIRVECALAIGQGRTPERNKEGRYDALRSNLALPAAHPSRQRPSEPGERPIDLSGASSQVRGGRREHSAGHGPWISAESTRSVKQR